MSFELNYSDGGNTGAAWGIFSGKDSLCLSSITIIAVVIILHLLYETLQRTANVQLIGKSAMHLMVQSSIQLQC